MKKYAVWLWLAFILLVVLFYLYYWFVYLQQPTSTVAQEEVLAWEETIDDEFDDEKYHETAEGMAVEEYVAITPLDVEEHVSFDIDMDQQPDISQVIHTSRLMALEALKNKKEDPKQSGVEEKVDSKPKIAIVIDDMGASPVRTKDIVAIQAPLTASFVTFASQLQKQVKQSEQSGHEIMIHVPMQPKSNIFVSNDVLKIDMSQEQITQAFKEMLKNFDSAKGINNHMGSLFTEHADKLAPVMKLLAEHHLFFLDSKTTAQSKGEETAQKYGVPCVHRHIFLDNENELGYILKQLEKTENVAKKNGYAIAIGHPKTQTSRALKLWIKTLADKNIDIVHLSQIVEQITAEAVAQ